MTWGAHLATCPVCGWHTLSVSRRNTWTPRQAERVTRLSMTTHETRTGHHAELVPLSAAQAHLLQDIWKRCEAAGQARFNGRMRRPIEALEKAGLIQASYDREPRSKGTGIELVEVITVRRKEPIGG